MADAVVAGPFDAVGVVAGALDDTGIGPVAALGVEVLLAADAGPDGREDVLPLVRGERPPGLWRGGRCGRCG